MKGNRSDSSLLALNFQRPLKPNTVDVVICADTAGLFSEASKLQCQGQGEDPALVKKKNPSLIKSLYLSPQLFLGPVSLLKPSWIQDQQETSYISLW